MARKPVDVTEFMIKQSNMGRWGTPTFDRWQMVVQLMGLWSGSLLPRLSGFGRIHGMVMIRTYRGR